LTLQAADQLGQLKTMFILVLVAAGVQVNPRRLKAVICDAIELADPDNSIVRLQAYIVSTHACLGQRSHTPHTVLESIIG
jgi:hypothetical protein